MDKDISLRPITNADLEFLAQVYVGTRQEELAPVAWSAEQKKEFLQMQFDAQHQYYLANYPRAQFQIIQRGSEPIGRLYLDRRATEIRIVDIALLPAQRHSGIGTLLMQEILAEGQARGVPVTIHVERFNPALRLYTRLGFRQVEDKGVYYFLEWTPNRVAHLDHARSIAE
jgi:ribosomal protein S18 acetylase RimI-like enzyme